MSRKQNLIFSCAVAFLLSASVRASAQGHAEAHRARIYGGVWLGFGGELESDIDAPLGISGSSTADLITTVGGQVGLEYVLMRYLALGAEFRLGGINTEALDDANVDRSKLIDIDLKPRLRYPFERLPIEIYVTVPFGLTIPRLSDDFQDIANFDEHVGWNLGVGGGVSVFPLSHLGVNVEPIWLLHQFKVDAPLDIDGKFTMRQFALLINLVLAL